MLGRNHETSLLTLFARHCAIQQHPATPDSLTQRRRQTGGGERKGDGRRTAPALRTPPPLRRTDFLHNPRLKIEFFKLKHKDEIEWDWL